MDNNEQNFINIVNATENNLKHVSLKMAQSQILWDFRFLS